MVSYEVGNNYCVYTIILLCYIIYVERVGEVMVESPYARRHLGPLRNTSLRSYDSYGDLNIYIYIHIERERERERERVRYKHRHMITHTYAYTYVCVYIYIYIYV